MKPALFERYAPRPLMLGISLEPAELVVVLARRENGSCRLIRRLSVPVTPGAILEDAQKAGARLAAHLAEAGIREKRCAVCLPPGWAMTAPAELPAVGAEDLRAYLALRAEREFPIPPAELRLAYSVYPLPDGKRCATLAAVPEKRVSAVQRMLAAAGCRAVSISLGLARCVFPRERGASVCFLTENDNVTMLVGLAGGVAALHVFDGAAALSADVLGREIRIALGRLPDAIRSALGEARFVGAKGAVESLRDAVAGPLRRLGVARLVDVEPEPVAADTDTSVPDGGAALAEVRRQLHAKPAVFEFVPAQVNRIHAVVVRFVSRRNRWVLAGLGCLAAALLLLLVQQARVEKRLKAEWAAIEPTVTELQQLQKKIRQFRPWFDAAPRSLEILEGLTAAFPQDGVVWARSVEIKENRLVSCSGFARSQTAFMETLDRLRGRPEIDDVQVQQVRGADPIQFTFKFIWRYSHEN
ncbi:MAG: hypothetical protein JXR37_33710 [Kiritimatiellae bacterium]|nr:hypothetical protein [Kiritimatiellia bacterium]